jgi:hypothetical protein
MGATRDRESEKRTNADGDALDQTHVLLLPTIRGEGPKPSQPSDICGPLSGDLLGHDRGTPEEGTSRWFALRR